MTQEPEKTDSDNLTKISPCSSCTRKNLDKNDCCAVCKRLASYNRGEVWTLESIPGEVECKAQALPQMEKEETAFCKNCAERKASGDDGLCGWCRGAKTRKNKQKRKEPKTGLYGERAVWKLAQMLRRELEEAKSGIFERTNNLHARLCVIEDLKVYIKELKDVYEAIENISLRCERLESLLRDHDHDRLGRTRLFVTMEEALEPLKPKKKQ